MFENKTISNIGLGCVTFGREIDEESSFAMMDYAFNHNINIFDTASAYGDGASESIVGKWVSKHCDLKNEIIIATKILPPYDAQTIERSVDESLKRLRLETIDLLYLHRWDSNIETSGSLYALNNLIVKGKIKSHGASNFTTEQLVNTLRKQKENKLATFQFVQNNNNLAVSDLGTEFKKVCVAHNIKIVTYSPLGAGFLTGKYQGIVQADTRFDLIPGHQDVYFNDESFSKLKNLQKIAERTGYTTSHLAIAWALHQPGIACVLVGGRTIEQIDQAISAASFNDAVLLAKLEKI
ncbi:MAG: aldo/keto reductase [Bacteroidota bacterium]|nr:aldo/keto reductase [Bacteroidota bacterium]